MPRVTPDARPHLKGKGKSMRCCPALAAKLAETPSKAPTVFVDLTLSDDDDLPLAGVFACTLWHP